MPNRGPVDLSLAEAQALLHELPPDRDVREAEDDEDRQRIQLLAKMRKHMTEFCTERAAAGDDGPAPLVFSVDEVDEILDSLPPPPALDDVRVRLSKARVTMLG